MQILEQQHQLSFHLQQQRLIELIRQGKTEEALEHAQEYLAPPGEEDPAFLEELGMPNDSNMASSSFTSNCCVAAERVSQHLSIMACLNSRGLSTSFAPVRYIQLQIHTEI